MNKERLREFYLILKDLKYLLATSLYDKYTPKGVNEKAVKNSIRI